MVFHSKAFEHVESVVNQDPFIMENYFQTYEINEIFEANHQNNWLMTSSQTLRILKKQPGSYVPGCFLKKYKVNQTCQHNSVNRKWNEFYLIDHF